jgi:hypothetical protein
MTKSQHIGRRKHKKTAMVIDERPAPVLPPDSPINPEMANAPIRTVNFVEVGDMVGPQLQLILQRLNKTHDTAKGGIHYFLPVRQGKVGSDIVFEKEFEQIGHELFEIVDKSGNVLEDATLRLKGGAQDVHVVRRQV